MQTGIANLPLHSGKCPPWLFSRMKNLGREISKIIIYEYGTLELIRRLSDPFFFQSLGCILGFDWHSSGITTTVCGALKEGLNEENLGLQICGGKGKTSLKTPEEIANTKLSLSNKQINNLIDASKTSAKVDNALIQDGFQLYHHCFFFDERGNWTVIQQGMREGNGLKDRFGCNGGLARRYHWLSENLQSMIIEPHTAICCNLSNPKVLNMTAKESVETQKVSVDIVKEGSIKVKNYLKEIKKLDMPMHHEIFNCDLSERGLKMIDIAKDYNPNSYEELIKIKGIGPKTIRSLALISDIIYGTQTSWKDPVKYSFAHGGKDGIPYSVNRKLMDENIELLKNAIENAKLGDKEKIWAIKKLNEFYNSEITL